MSKADQKKGIKQIKQAKETLLGNSDISLNTILNSEECQTIINESREYRERYYSPLKTIFMFVKQVLNPDKSCRNAVAGAVAEQISSNEKEMSINTGPYSNARKRLPYETLHELVYKTGNSATLASPEKWKWHGKTIKSLDGTVLTMSDTHENQLEFPQHGNQKKGAGFPIARLVAVMSLNVGTVLDYAVASYKGKGTGEQSLFRELRHCIEKDDILLGDCYYPSFF
jgi:hypothetical protein